MTVQAEVSVYPLRTPKLSGPITQFCRVLQSRGLHVQTRSMSTFVTGELESLFEALEEGFALLARENDVVAHFSISNACPEGVGPEPVTTERTD